MSTREELVAKLVADRVWALRSALREAEALSEPCPEGHWRWADVRPGSYGRKTESELAADRERAVRRASEIRDELRTLGEEP